MRLTVSFIILARQLAALNVVIARCMLSCHVARLMQLLKWTRPSNVRIAHGLSIRPRASVIDWRSIHFWRRNKELTSSIITRFLLHDFHLIDDGTVLYIIDRLKSQRSIPTHKTSSKRGTIDRRWVRTLLQAAACFRRLVG